MQLSEAQQVFVEHTEDELHTAQHEGVDTAAARALRLLHLLRSAMQEGATAVFSLQRVAAVRYALCAVAPILERLGCARATPGVLAGTIAASPLHDGLLDAVIQALRGEDVDGVTDEHAGADAGAGAGVAAVPMFQGAELRLARLFLSSLPRRAHL